MKIMAVLFLLVSVFSFGDGVAEFNFQMELGYFLMNNWFIESNMYTNKGLDFNIAFSGEIEILDTVFIGGSISTNMSIKTNKNASFSPSDVWYSFNAGLRFNNIEIGFRHNCCHPLYTYIQTTGIDDVFAEGAYEETYIRFKGEIKLF